MAHITTLTDGTTDIALVYVASTQEGYYLKYGAQLSSPEPLAIWHNSDQAPPELSDLIDKNRTAFFELLIDKEATIDDVLNKIAVLRRWVDGADQQAARYWLLGDVDRINLKIQRNNASNATIQPVIYGFVDDSETHYTAVSTLNEIAYNVTVGLTLAPYGEAENEISLHNNLKNSAFLFQGTTLGLAANWTLVSTPTPTLDTSIYIAGGQSQKLTASTAAQGVESAAVSEAVTAGAGFFWIYVASGTVTVALRDTTAGADRDTADIDNTDSGGVSDQNYTDSGGRVWYRVPLVSASLTSGNSHKLRAYSNGAAATFYVNMAYLDLGATAVPDCWAGCASIYNRADQTTTNPEYVNWIDVWGVTGDVNALVNHAITSTVTGANGETFNLAAWQDKSDKLATDFDHWVEGESLSVDLESNATWALATVASSSGAASNNVYRLTAGTGGGFGSLSYTMPYARVPCKVFLRAKSSVSSTTTARLGSASSGATSPVVYSNTVTLDTDYQDYNMGLVYLDKPQGSNEDGGTFNVVGTLADTSETLDIDRIFFIPLIDGHLITGGGLVSGTMDGAVMNISGTEERVWLDRETVPIGTFPTVRSGPYTTRFYYHRYDAASASTHYLTDQFDVTLTVLPRTRHLLGTI